MEAVTDAPARQPADDPAEKPARQRRKRSLTESLLSIVLGLEAVLVFFITLAVYGLRALPPAEAFGGGVILIVLLVIGAWAVRYRWGVWYGWLLQAVLVATGIVLAALYIAAAIFVALWIFCFVRARQLEGSNPQAAQPTDPTEGEST